MKRNEQFLLNEIAEEYILIPVEQAAIDFVGVATLNDMGATIWKLLEKEMTIQQLLEAILAEYDVTAEQAKADIEKFLELLRSRGCIVE